MTNMNFETNKYDYKVTEVTRLLKEFVFQGSNPCREVTPEFHKNLRDRFKCVPELFGVLQI